MSWDVLAVCAPTLGDVLVPGILGYLVSWDPEGCPGFPGMLGIPMC